MKKIFVPYDGYWLSDGYWVDEKEFELARINERKEMGFMRKLLFYIFGL